MAGLLVRPAELGAKATARTNEGAGLSADDLEVRFFRESKISATVQLVEFALARGIGHLTDGTQKFGVPDGSAEQECIRQEKVTKDDRRLVSPEIVDGSTPATKIGLIEDIIVNESCHVNRFHHGGQLQVIIRWLYAGLRRHPGHQDECRPKHLSAISFNMTAEGIDRREIAGKLTLKDDDNILQH